MINYTNKINYTKILILKIIIKFDQLYEFLDELYKNPLEYLPENPVKAQLSSIENVLPSIKQSLKIGQF